MQCDKLIQANKSCNEKNTSGIFSIPPEQFTVLATAIGFLLANDLDMNEQNSLGNFLMAIGQVLVTIASQKAIFESQQDNQQVMQRLEFLKKQISDIENEIGQNSK